jgi:hypothetical protein
MIPIVRIKAEDFIGGEFEELVWKTIYATKQKVSNEFMLCFHVDKVADVKRITTNIQNHEYALQFKTTIKTWAKCQQEFVFLDVITGSTKEQYNSRFQYSCPAPINVINAMDFVVNHFNLIRESNSLNDNTFRKQKRNDAPEYDYNKK